MATTEQLSKRLREGRVIPAAPLALDSGRKLDPVRQRALFRYYFAAGAGGLAVGVHTTQFAIRDPKIGLFRPVLELAAGEIRNSGQIGIAGICGPTSQADNEATMARTLGFDAGLLSLGALRSATEDELIAHCQTIAQIIPLVGFYLQPAAGGRILPFSFWRRFAEIENVVAIKIAPFNRYQTLDVIRAVAESGRTDIALYTGNDDHILLDLLTPFRFSVHGEATERRIVGGLLGQWAVWTKKAVELLAECRRFVHAADPVPIELLAVANELTDANAAIFDAANGYAGCIPGIHEILRRRGLLEGNWCLDPNETLSKGQCEEIDRICGAYPHLQDDDFIAHNLDKWLK
ncbi:MAG: dihydrodipicolinate synthase/N-acetylneuraminate lyase [Verrucomicrobiales bacterium]|nr:dihydrodipicolinate synthase/N-acetylneuraminate lyase [Verrucomicrobiales bacterium]